MWAHCLVRLGIYWQGKSECTWFFAFVFTGKAYPQTWQSLWEWGHTAGDEDRVRDHLTTWTCTSLWDQLGCIQELADVIMRLLFVVFKRSWHMGEASQAWKRPCHTHPRGGWEKGYRELQAGLQPSSVKMMEQIITETVSKTMKDEKGVGGSSQHGFEKGCSYLISLTAFCYMGWTRKRWYMSYTLALARLLTQSLKLYLSLNWWDTGSANRW